MADPSIGDPHMPAVPESSAKAMIGIGRSEELAPIKKLAASQLPDLSEFWARMPSVPCDSGRFLEEDR